MSIVLDKLRAYQTGAIGKLRAAIGRGMLRPLLYAPTGAGKTIIACALIESALLKGKRVAFLVNRVQLVEQTCAALAAHGIRYGVVQGENTENVHRPVLVCSIQTVQRKGLPPDIDLLLVDEAHGVPGSVAYRELFESCNNIPIIGFSATPFAKGMGKHYPKLFGPLFHEIVIAATIAELIEAGFLVDCDIYTPSTPDLSGVKVVAGEYQQRELGEAVDKPMLVGDIVQHWHSLALGQQTICFATNIAHSRHICEQFVAAGVRAEHCDHYATEDERQQIVSRFKNHETTVLCNAGMFAEGFDSPSASCMILARPTKSLIRYIQMIGRVLRPYDGKGRALVLDHSGSCVELGFPTEDLPLFLDDGKPKQSKAGDDRRPEQLPKVCPKCKFMKPAGVHVCPKCGFAPQKQCDIAPADGTLEKMERVKKVEYSHEQKQQFYSEILTIRREKGRNDGWVAHTYRDRYGVWPKNMQKIEAMPSDGTRAFVQHKMIRFAKGVEAQAKAGAASHAP